jgi:hypothetical protein
MYTKNEAQKLIYHVFVIYRFIYCSGFFLRNLHFHFTEDGVQQNTIWETLISKYFLYAASNSVIPTETLVFIFVIT